jgi:hypothetical protein
MVLLLPALQAQTIRDRILGNVQIVPQEGCAVIDVGFKYPVRYVKHFSINAADQSRTRLLPILVKPTQSEALFKRESVRLQPDNPAALAEVMYEGNLEGGPFLTLVFKEPVAFQVQGAADQRHLTVAVSRSGSPDSCMQ